MNKGPTTKEIDPKNIQHKEETKEDEKTEEFALRDADEKEIEEAGKLKEKAEKPRYDKKMKCVVQDVLVRIAEKPDKDKYGESYHTWVLVMVYKDANGLVARENFGGFKKYADKVYAGPKSAYFRAKKELEIFLECEKPLTFKEFRDNLLAKACYLKSEDYDVSGNKGWKNLPIEFLEREEEK